MIADKWVLSIGGYVTDFKTTAAVGSGSVIGTIIRLEETLGLDENKTFLRGDGFYRFNSRHAIGFGFWSLKRDGVGIIDEEIEWDGITYPAMALLDTTFDVGWYRADWRYSFMRMDRGEAGFNLGLSFYDFSASIEGMGMVGGTAGNFKGEESLTVPVPTFGLFTNFAITPNVLFKSAFNWLSLEYDDFDIEVSDVTLVFEWYFSEHVGIGGGSSITDIDYKDTGNNPFSVEYKQTGFLAYFTFAWGDVG